MSYSGSEKATVEPDSNPEKNPEINLCDQTGDELLRRWKQGDERAAVVLVDRHSMRLIAMVAGRLNRRFRNTVDPEDIVQSAMGSFFNAVRQSKLKFSGSVSLWRLLATFARRKMARSIERFSASRRGGDRVRVSMDEIERLLLGADSHWDAESAQGFLDENVADLPEDLREVLERLLAGFTQLEIAESLGVDERTVRRRVVRLRESLVPSQTNRPRTEVDSFESATLPQIRYSEFVLGKLIGTGGFGKVYRASMRSDDSMVAVKFLRKMFWQNDEARHSFLREIDAASRIQHTGVIRHFGWGQSPHGGPYVVCQWIDGQTLDQCRTESAENFINYLQQICEALAAIHEAGIVHGDITPNNILVTSTGQTVITDFGFSRIGAGPAAVGESVDQFETPCGGTPGFAAPEQISPAFGQICPQTDIYAVGGLAWWFLTGKPPHDGADVESTLESTIAAAEIDVKSFHSNSSSEETIKRVAAAALFKAISQRPQSIMAIRRLLDATVL